MNSATDVKWKWSQSDIQKPRILLKRPAIFVSVNCQFWPGQCYCHSNKNQAVLPVNLPFPWSWSVAKRSNPETVLSAKWHFLPSGSITRIINIMHYKSTDNFLTVVKNYKKQTWDCIIHNMAIIHCQSNYVRQTQDCIMKKIVYL